MSTPKKSVDYSFPRYLLSKQSVDDRALNQHTFQCLQRHIAGGPLRVVEVGGGIGTMLARLLLQGFLGRGQYTLIDEMEENITFAAGWLTSWALEHGFGVQPQGANSFRLWREGVDLQVNLVHASLSDYARANSPQANLLIAHALLDLLPMPHSLHTLFSLLAPGGLAWLTINFDGVTSLEPAILPALDEKIESLYHQSMDARPGGGDSKSGRHLFGHLAGTGAEICAAGASDWVVYAQNGAYPADEKSFLQFILHFFEESLRNHPQLSAQELDFWLAKRREQLEEGRLVYIAHQMDFLVKPPAR